MPIKHGLHCKFPPPDQRSPVATPEERMKFRFGIHDIFYALKMAPRLPGKPEGMKAAQLEYHFGKVCERFVFSLQHLNGLLPRLLQEEFPSIMRLQLEAECDADHVLTYLNVLVDDVALVILLATGHPISKHTDSMSGLVRIARDSLDNRPIPPALKPVMPLLLELLTRADSWWERAFKPKTGARQRIVHNQNLATFQVQGSELWSLLQSPFSETSLCRCAATRTRFLGSTEKEYREGIILEAVFLYSWHRCVSISVNESEEAAGSAPEGWRAKKARKKGTF